MNCFTVKKSMSWVYRSVDWVRRRSMVDLRIAHAWSLLSGATGHTSSLQRCRDGWKVTAILTVFGNR
jgi:uncharacterized paraquat-inducible protein A